MLENLVPKRKRRVPRSSTSALGLALEGWRYQRTGRIAEAAGRYADSLRLDPANASVWNNYGAALLDLGFTPDAVRSFAFARQLTPHDCVPASNFLHALLHDWTAGMKRIAGEHISYGRSLEEEHSSAPVAPTRRKLRVGYLSPGFGEHAISQFFCGILQWHDNTRFEVYCYSARTPDPVTAKLRRLCRNWYDIHDVDDDGAAELIRGHNLDILVDRGGYIEGNRIALLGRRLAPIQVSTVDYPATLGIGAVQYHLTDAIINPPGTQRFYSETLVNLRVAMNYSIPERRPRVTPLPARRNAFVTFGAFHRMCKHSPDIVEAWALILSSVPRSRLILHHAYGSDPIVRETLRRRTESLLAKHRISMRRVRWIGPLSHYDSMRLYGGIDLALDAFPYSGFTTTAESLFMGVPVVTVYDDRPMSRHTLTMLRAIGLTEFAAESVGAYVDIAVRWANDLPRLSMLRASLRKLLMASPLCDARAYTRDLEAQYREMYRRTRKQAALTS